MAKSTHQLFKYLLLSEESLSPEQESTLKEHLRECAECRQQEAAWTNVQQMFERAPVLPPAAGFTVRLQERMAVQRVQAQRKRAWTFFGVTAGIALVLSALLVYVTVQEIISPLQLLSKGIYFFVMLFGYYRQISSFVGSVNPAIPILSITGLVFFTGFVSLLSVLWVVAYRKLSSMRRIIS